MPLNRNLWSLMGGMLTIGLPGQLGSPEVGVAEELVVGPEEPAVGHVEPDGKRNKNHSSI